MTEVTLSSKNHIVVPREARDALGIAAGDKLLVVVRGTTVILARKPGAYAKAVTGLAKDLYGSDYLGEERESWS